MHVIVLFLRHLIHSSPHSSIHRLIHPFITPFINSSPHSSIHHPIHQFTPPLSHALNILCTYLMTTQCLIMEEHSLLPDTCKLILHHIHAPPTPTPKSRKTYQMPDSIDVVIHEREGDHSLGWKKKPLWQLQTGQEINKSWKLAWNHQGCYGNAIKGCTRKVSILFPL